MGQSEGKGKKMRGGEGGGIRDERKETRKEERNEMNEGRERIDGMMREQ